MTTKPQSTTEPKLEPCPLCACKVFKERFEKFSATTQGILGFSYRCPKCRSQFAVFGKSETEAMEVWNTRIVPASAAPVVDQRRIEIALGYIKRAANRELPKLPCRVDEMTERELEIFKVGAAAVGNLQFIARELDALPAASVKQECTWTKIDEDWFKTSCNCESPWTDGPFCTHCGKRVQVANEGAR